MLSTTQTPASHRRNSLRITVPPREKAKHEDSPTSKACATQANGSPESEQDDRACQNCADVQKAVEAMQEEMQELEDLLYCLTERLAQVEAAQMAPRHQSNEEPVASSGRDNAA
ncbi:hypothetical protein HII31_02734 [Pseudocercospora fuligena]|uniref:Uncharacterized protein n=1 Tax=Pseudocercospora fuligena TaxID=685502 RepID=A0A8H6VMQ5_9PEZI|nr:hypothetical protein HII31_02734 [Pseudocercospora fuligena]